MNEDVTKELPMSDSEKLTQLLTISRNIITGLNQLDTRITALEAKDVVTKPLWQEMRADQQRILERMDRVEVHLQQQDERMDRIEAHLKQQDEKMDAGFRKLGDKFDLMAQDYYDLRADVVDLKRRVTRLEPVN